MAEPVAQGVRHRVFSFVAKSRFLQAPGSPDWTAKAAPALSDTGQYLSSKL